MANVKEIPESPLIKCWYRLPELDYDNLEKRVINNECALMFVGPYPSQKLRRNMSENVSWGDSDSRFYLLHDVLDELGFKIDSISTKFMTWGDFLSFHRNVNRYISDMGDKYPHAEEMMKQIFEGSWSMISICSKVIPATQAGIQIQPLLSSFKGNYLPYKDSKTTILYSNIRFIPFRYMLGDRTGDTPEDYQHLDKPFRYLSLHVPASISEALENLSIWDKI
jgi:hypothetical protein